MDLRGLDDNKGRFVCPSDRQLALRAKLQTGWSSVKPTIGSLNAKERNAIIAVVKRNEQLETAERQRVGRLVERVEKIKLHAAECGPRFCRLCGQTFGLLGPSKFICDDCKKPVCSKCATELHSKVNSKDAWLCKICSETRELWMKTGAWFYKAMPKYEVPPPRASNARPDGSGAGAGHSHLHLLAPVQSAVAPKPAKLRIQCVDTSSEEDDDGDNDDDGTDGTSSTASERYFMRERPSSFLRKHPLFNRKAATHSNESSPLRTMKKTSGGPSASSSTAAERPKHPQQSQQSMRPTTTTMTPSTNGTATTVANNTTSAALPTTSSYIVEWETVSITSRLNGTLSRRGSVSSSMSMSETSSANSSNADGFNQHGGGGCGVGGLFSSGALVSGSNCKEPSLGWLELIISYSEANHTLDCAVVRARDLPAMDTAGLADAFCKVNIITEYGTVKQAKWFRTRTVHKTINPEFNETVRFMGVEPDELAQSLVYVVVLDDDRYGSDFLGTAKVALAPLHHNESVRISIPLESEDQHSIEAAASGPWTNGQILVAMCYNTRRRALMVQVKRCINLLAKDKNGQSDPFVKLQIKPDAHRNKKSKTNIKWRTLNPVFDEEFVFETRPNELDKQSVLFAVWDKDLGKSNDFLGALTLGAHSKGRRLKQWKDCIRMPDQYHEQWHYLSNEQNNAH